MECHCSLEPKVAPHISWVSARAEKLDKCMQTVPDSFLCNGLESNQSHNRTHVHATCECIPQATNRTLAFVVAFIGWPQICTTDRRLRATYNECCMLHTSLEIRKFTWYLRCPAHLDPNKCHHRRRCWLVFPTQMSNALAIPLAYATPLQHPSLRLDRGTARADATCPHAHAHFAADHGPWKKASAASWAWSLSLIVLVAALIFEGVATLTNEAQQLV